MKLRNIILNKRNQTQSSIYSLIPFAYGTDISKTHLRIRSQDNGYSQWQAVVTKMWDEGVSGDWRCLVF